MMERTYSIVVVDDEKLATRLIAKFCNDDQRLELIAQFNDSLEALQFLQKNEVDILILDIEMPELNGLELTKRLDAKTKIIFSTAYENFALDGFNLSAIDYLLKPYSPQRFTTAIDKAIYLLQLENKNTSDISEKQTHIVVKTNYMKQKVELNQIVFIESFDDYITFHFEEKESITIRKTLKTVLEELPKNDFLRIHRSYVIALDKVSGYQKNKVFMGNKELPVSSAYKNEFLSKLD